MPFKLVEVDLTKDFDQVIEVQWASYETPLQSFFRMFCPLRGDGPTARQESLRECTDRQLEWHKSDPTSYWAKVVDENDNMAGACLWKICPTNPFEKDDHSEVYWYPEGEAREYVGKALQQFDEPRRRMGARPQVCETFPQLVTSVNNG